MGLDGVELVLDFEEAFQVALSNEEAAALTTPGKVADAIMQKVETAAGDVCLTQHGFYKIRKILAERFSLARKGIRPETGLESIFPEKSRRADWSAFLAGIDPPKTFHAPLEFSEKANRTIFLLSCLLAGLTGHFLSIGLPYFVLLLAAFGFLLLAVLNPWKVHFPRSFQRVKDLVKFTHSIAKVKPTREEVLRKVIEITSKKMGIPEEKISEDSRFVQDLGID